ncbi:G-protein alpha subunit [Ceratobasidium sp. AG-I]|nr:G-protein alpha subunit [Ceratobasidium sp. AG-I]
MLALHTRVSRNSRRKRLQEEAAAKRKSNEIDEQLRLESVAIRQRRAKERRILVLGQSESGKSTLLKNFILSTGGGFDSERALWRLIIFHNLVRSILDLLEEINQPIHSNAEHPDNDKFHQTHSITFKTMRVRLSPLSQIEDLIASTLSSESPPSTSSPSPVEPTSIWTTKANCFIPNPEINYSSPGWKSALRKLNAGQTSPRSSLEYSIDFDNASDPGNLLVSFHKDLVELGESKVVWEMLKRRNVRIENMSGFFLDNINRIAGPRYIPTDYDILKARRSTLQISETQCTLNCGREKGTIWRFFDVGGARYQRAAWAPYFDNVDCIFFLVPISAFDQVLAEDPSVNRLEDSFIMWRDLCKNKILAGATMVLFLNKCDLLQAKLEAGVQLKQFLTSYGDRPNDYATVTKTLMSKFNKIRRKYNPNAQIFMHCITATNSETTGTVIGVVRDGIMKQNLQNLGYFS